MKKSEPGLHIHNCTKGAFPTEAVELFTRWTVQAVEKTQILQGFRPLPASTHIHVYTDDKSHGEAFIDGIAKIFVRPGRKSRRAGDGRFPGIDFLCYDWAEMLVSLVAHECAHLRGVPGVGPGDKVPKRMGVWATGERTGEQLAQVVSVTVLEQFRVVRAVLELNLQKIKYVLK